LNARQTLDSIRQLRAAAAEIAAAMRELQREFRSRRFALKRRHDTAAETQQIQVAETMTEIDRVNDERADRYRAAYDRRRQRVERLAATARRNLPKRIEEERSRYLGSLQWRKRKAEAARQTGVASFEREVAVWSGALEDCGTRMEQLQRRALIAVGPFGSHRRMLETAARDHSGRDVVSSALDASGSTPAEREAWAAEVNSLTEEAEAALLAYAKAPLGGLFRLVPLSALLVVAVIAGFLSGGGVLTPEKNLPLGAAVGGGLVVVFLILHQAAVAGGSLLAKKLAGAAAAAQGALDSGKRRLAAERGSLEERLDEALQKELAAVQDGWDRVDEVATAFEKRARSRITGQPPRLLAAIERNLQRRLEEIEHAKSQNQRSVTVEAEERLSASETEMNAELAKLGTEESGRRSALLQRWRDEVLPEWEKLAGLAMPATVWTEESIAAWEPPAEFPAGVRLGEISLDLAGGAESILPEDEAFTLPDTRIQAPLALGFPDCGGLLVETDAPCDEDCAGVLNHAILSVLTASPAGKSAFTILDPVGLGQNFAGLMHLADYEENLITRRIWTQRDQIDERLADLNEHIEKVIQMYLRNEYETITQYNEQAGSVAEKYHFLVVADFPSGFSETAIQRLQSIVVSGPRCGVFPLVHWNRKHPLPDEFAEAELRAGCLCLAKKGRAFQADAALAAAGAGVKLDAPPAPALALDLAHRIGRASIDSNRVQVPFSQIAPAGDLWTESTTQELRVPVGRTGATKLQYLAIGKGTRQHALFAGKTGSGKSTLFHVIITNLALHCSPDEVEFYLIDFKKGVEFKCYAEAGLPHARVIAIESDREFGLSVLQRVDDELKRRGDLFRALGAQDIPGYKRAGGTEPMPRSLLIIDEFQEFFVEDDAVAQTASLLFDRIVRQGRAFGIHVLLGSQTLGGAYTLARATLGQMVIRVALQCNEADAALIMDENNPAPRLLSRPGEGIYNDAAGAVEGNSPFQVVWISDEERNERLRAVRELAAQRGLDREPPVVFEGNAPADARANTLLAAVLRGDRAKFPALPTIWLGAPNAIKGPTEAVFRRQSGGHLLVVGQREESVCVMLGLAITALGPQLPEGSRVFLFHAGGDTPEMEFLIHPPGSTAAVTEVLPGDTQSAMTEIHAELQRRSAGPSGAGDPPVFVLVHGLQKFKKLRQEDDLDFSFSSSDEGPKPGAMFSDLITEGAPLGMHLIVTVDTYNNVSRCLSRKSLTEFEMRVLFQMSANDSASLVDSTKAAALGLHRALYHNEQQGVDETFRPYALPPAGWPAENPA
jgi:S-DNA-T family DNA segregation ATPase FtsK/SpoIIIE